MNNSEKKLTIAIPTYNRAVFLKKQLNSINKIFASHATEIDLLVIDNASTDNTYNFLQEFTSTITLQKIRNESNLGMIGNIQKCFELSKTDFTWVIGDDDKLDSLDVQELINEINSVEISTNLLHFDCNQIDAKNNRIIKESVYNVYENILITNSEFCSKIKKCGFSVVMWISGNIVRTKKIREAINMTYEQDVIAMPLFWNLYCGLSSKQVLLLKCNQISMMCNNTSWQKRYSSQIFVYDLPLIQKKLENNFPFDAIQNLLPIVRKNLLVSRLWFDIILIQKNIAIQKLKNAYIEKLITIPQIFSIFLFGPIAHFLKKIIK